VPPFTASWEEVKVAIPVDTARLVGFPPDEVHGNMEETPGV
jgi:hypothetical protein